MLLLFLDQLVKHISYEIDLQIVVLFFRLDTELDHIEVLVQSLDSTFGNKFSCVLVIPNEFIISEVKRPLFNRISC